MLKFEQIIELSTLGAKMLRWRQSSLMFRRV